MSSPEVKQGFARGLAETGDEIEGGQTAR